MNNLQNITKKKFVLIISLFLTIFIIAISFIILYYKPTPYDDKKYYKNDEIVKTAQELGSKGMATRVKKAVDKFSNTKLSDDQRYKALEDVYFYFAAAYTTTYNPKLREYINKDFNNYYKEQLPKFYNDVENYGKFDIPCADPICGKNIDSDLNKIISLINELQVDPVIKGSSISDLKTAAYKPDNNEIDKQDKIYGFKLVIRLLNSAEDKNASETAKMLSDYLRKNYNIQ